MQGKRPFLIGIPCALLAVALVVTTEMVPAFGVAASIPQPIALPGTEQEETHPAGKAAPALPAVVNKPDIAMNHRVLAASVLQRMPKTCQSSLQSFFVRYDNPEERGLGGKSSMIISGNVGDDEFRALFVHEFGHVTDLGCLKGTAASGTTEFVDGKDQMYEDDPSVAFYRISWAAAKQQKKGSQKADFVSGYASWDAFEDFAETYAYFMLHREKFTERAKANAALAAKYEWMMDHFGNVTPVGASLDTTRGVPWDITKLSYSWVATK